MSHVNELQAQFISLRAVVLEVVREHFRSVGLEINEISPLISDNAMCFLFIGRSAEGGKALVKVAPYHESIIDVMDRFVKDGVETFRKKLLEWVRSESVGVREEADGYRNLAVAQLPIPSIFAATSWYIVREYPSGCTLDQELRLRDFNPVECRRFELLLATIGAQLAQLTHVQNLDSIIPCYEFPNSSVGAMAILTSEHNAQLSVPFGKLRRAFLEHSRESDNVIVHGDLKPTNIMITESSKVVLIDPMTKRGPREVDLGKFLVRLTYSVPDHPYIFERLAGAFWDAYIGSIRSWGCNIDSPRLLENSFFFGLLSLEMMLSEAPKKYSELIGLEYQSIAKKRARIKTFFESGVNAPKSFQELHCLLQG